MKKSILRLASVAALTTVAMLAQPQLMHAGGGPGGTGTAPTTDPATIVARQVSFLTTFLTLSTGQATQASTIFTTALTAVQALQTQVETAETALATAIKANATATITTQATALGNLHGQIVAANAKADAAFYLLLTADQKTKLDTLGSNFFGAGLGGIHIPGGGR